MFTKPLSYIVLPSSLKEAYEEISKTTSGIDNIGYSEFERSLSENLAILAESIKSGTYVPEPILKIEIDKPQSEEKRPISISAIKDKVVQRLLYTNLNPYFDKHFSNKSYAYRPEKSAIHAINRVTDFLNKKKLVVLKSDIDDFFESIDHDIMLKILDTHIEDKQLIRLISLFLQTGGFHDMTYKEHFLGVHQGDILSPLLSNIYLNEMDRFLENKGVSFVRYADDFVLLFPKKKEAYEMHQKLKSFLSTIGLSLNKEKTTIVHIDDGFEFLGIAFKGRERHIQNERFQKSVSKLIKLSKNKTGFVAFTEQLNIYLNSLKNYYLKILSTDSPQFKLLQDALLDTLSHKVYLSKKSKEITSKKIFRNLLEAVHFDLLFSDSGHKYIELIMAKGYEKYRAGRSYKDETGKIARKRDKYAKKFADESTLHVVTKGLSLGISKGKVVLKKYGKVQKSYPLSKISRIILEGKGISLSTNVIQRCAKESITIDFIDSDMMSYASLVTYKSAVTQTIHSQAMLLGTPVQLQLAKEFIRGKAKNQMNYIKYLDKYHHVLEKHIDTMRHIFVNIKFSESIDVLMGYEGSLSVAYWDALKEIIDAPFEKRITYGARDVVNSSLNYGYAILYGKIQSSLVQAGLSLNISFLHALDEKKPTLTFDMIEEFRSYVVDRTIVSMINRNEPLKLDSKGLLTLKSRQLISRNIKEKLGSYVMYKKESRKVENIIETQAYKLAKVVRGESKKYKAFIGKF